VHDDGLVDVNNAHPTFHPPIAHNLRALALSKFIDLAFGLDDQIERFVIAACKRRKMG